MAENDTSNKKKDSTQPEKGSATASEENLISLEDLDQILNDDDPEFAKSLEEIRQDESLNQGEVQALGVESEVIEENEDEVVTWAQKLEVRKPKLFKYLVNPFLNRASSIKFRLRTFRINFWLNLRQAISAARTQVPEFLGYLKRQSVNIFKFAKGQIKAFWARGWSVRFMSLIFVALIVLLGWLLKQNLHGGWLPQFGFRLEKSLADGHGNTESFLQDQQINFARAFPQADFIVLLGKIKLNFQPSPEHKNPMGVLEFYVNLDAQDTAIEVKDRERELLDFIQRNLETLTYEDTEGLAGKNRIKAQIRKAVNDNLNQGRVTQVYFKHIITKP